MRTWLAIGLCIFATGALAQAYSWVDKSGKVVFSDTPPPADAKKVQERKNADKGGGNGKLSYEAGRAAQNFPVTLFASPDCKAPCDQARKLLARRGVPYTEKDVSQPEFAAELRTISKDRLSVPSMKVGSQSSVGFEEGPWNILLDAAGYPQSGRAAPVTKAQAKKPEVENAPSGMAGTPETK